MNFSPKQSTSYAEYHTLLFYSHRHIPKSILTNSTSYKTLFVLDEPSFHATILLISHGSSWRLGRTAASTSEAKLW
jgi:hypothetical protein